MTSGTYQEFYENGDGNYHDNKRRNPQWYDNKALFEMIQELIKQMNDYKVEMRKYNGLKEDNQKQWEEMSKLAKMIADNAALPCKRDDSWRKVERLIEDSQNAKAVAEAKNKTYEAILRWGGWIFGLTGATLGVISFLGSVRGWW